MKVLDHKIFYNLQLKKYFLDLSTVQMHCTSVQSIKRTLHHICTVHLYMYVSDIIRRTFQIAKENYFHLILYVLLNTATVCTRIKFNISMYYPNINKVGSIYFISFILISMTQFNSKFTWKDLWENRFCGTLLAYITVMWRWCHLSSYIISKSHAPFQVRCQSACIRPHEVKHTCLDEWES